MVGVESLDGMRETDTQDELACGIGYCGILGGIRKTWGIGRSVSM